MADDPYSEELKKRGNWVVAAIESNVFLPTKVTVVQFRGQRLFIVPGTDELYPMIAVNLTGGRSHQDGQRLLFHFLSSLSWVEGRGINVVGWSGGSHAFRMKYGPQKTRLINEHLDLDYFPDPDDKKTRWALAFYREGLSLANIAFAALSFFKIINIVVTRAKDQIAWINSALPSISEREAVERVKALQSAGVIDIGDYLYGSGRCAIAHAGSDPTVDPEDPAD